MNAESVIKAAERRGAAWRHAFVYFWLVFTTVTVLLDERLTTPAAVTAAALSAGLGAWYWYWQIARGAPGAADRKAGRYRVYLAGAIGAWLVLVLIDSGFAVAGVVVLAPYCFSKVRWALALLVLSVVGWLWQEAPTGLGWSEIVVALLILGSGAAVAGYMATLSRQNDERQRLIEQLRSAQAELASAERHAGVLAERQRLARDIHDTLTQGFASIVMFLEAAEEALGASHGAAHHVAAALRSARDNLAESRRVVWALRPEIGGERFPEAAKELLARMEQETGVRTDLVVTGTPWRLDHDADASLLRVMQEALPMCESTLGRPR